MRAIPVLLLAAVCGIEVTKHGSEPIGPGRIQDSRAAPSWAVVLEKKPDPAIVTNPELRLAIEKAALPWRVRHKASGIELLLIPPGTYFRGKSPRDDMAEKREIPAHKVTLTKPYYVGRYEVTNAQFKSFDKSYRSGELGNGVSLNDDQYPVVGLGWKACKAFCDQFRLRLLTDAEWEWACRAGTTTRYPWGDDPDGGKGFGNVADKNAWRPTTLPIVYFSFDDGMKFAAPVGSFPANGFGLHDMLGNACEWCSDRFDEEEYQRCAGGVRDPRGPDRGAKCVIRGGSWMCGPKDSRVSVQRALYSATKQDGNMILGFRVAADP